MRIGVDAYYLSSSHIDGLGNYLLRLLKALSRIDAENEYILYTPGIAQHFYAEAMRRNSRFSIAVIPGIFSRSRRLWLQSPSLIRRAARDRIDLFFAGAEYFPLLLPRAIRVAVTIHDVAFKAMPEAISIPNMIFYRFFFPLFVRRADFFFTVSHHSKREMIDYLGIEESAIRVVYNGIELDDFPAGREGDKRDSILFVGTLQPRKNLANLIKAFDLIANRVKADLVVVGGSGWKNHSVRSLIEGLAPEVRQRITFCGYVAGDELPALYRKAKLFVLPSLHEGFCLPILEAMASGTAVITARSAAIPEVFGDAAAYVNPLSPEDIGRRIEELLTNHTLRASFVRKGRTLSKQYSVEQQAAGYLDAFRAIQRGEFKGKGVR